MLVNFYGQRGRPNVSGCGTLRRKLPKSLGNMMQTGSIEEGAKRIKQGELVAFATETVYGLGANALDPVAVAKVFAAKGRPRFNPLIVHVASLEEAEMLAKLPAAARLLATRFWPGPLTLLLEKKPLVPDIVTAGSPLVAVRIPAHALALKLIRLAGVPIAAPSANRFMAPSPTTAAHVASQHLEGVSLIIDGGPCTVGLESTIIGWNQEQQPVLYRPGGLERELIAKELGQALLTPTAGSIAAPGMLKRHYAPSLPLQLESEHNRPRHLSDNTALLCLQPEPGDAALYSHILSLAPETGSLHEAASRLFAMLHQLGQLPVNEARARLLPEQGLGLAINDRLRRATARDGLEDHPGVSGME